MDLEKERYQRIRGLCDVDMKESAGWSTGQMRRYFKWWMKKDDL